MKKLISLALTLAILASLAISVSAERIVGTDTNHNYKDGVTSITGNTNNTTSVEIKVSAGEYQSRYAVDVEYADLTFSIAGANMVWDVTTLQYVVAEGGTFTAPDSQAIYVYNRSDKTVDVAWAVAPAAGMASAPMELEVTTDKNTIEAATPKNGTTEGTPGKATITVNPTLVQGKTWNDVANHFAPYLVGVQDYTIATVTLTITQTPVNNG